MEGIIMDGERDGQMKNFTHKDGVSLKEYFEARIRAVEDGFDTRLKAVIKSVDVANVVIDSRLATMNEFREAMKDQAARMVTRVEVETKMERVSDDIADLKQYRDQMEGKASQTSVIVSMLFGAAGLVIGVISLLK